MIKVNCKIILENRIFWSVFKLDLKLEFEFLIQNMYFTFGHNIDILDNVRYVDFGQ